MQKCSSVKPVGFSVMARACTAADGTGSLDFTNNVTADKSIRASAEGYRAVLFSQI